MGFVSVALLTISALGLTALGTLMLQGARRRPGSRLLRWSGAAVLCLAAGFALLLVAPLDVEAPVRVIGTGVLMAAYGVLWGAARRFDRRSASFEAVSAGALAWLLAAALLDPSAGARIWLTATIVAVYSLAAAFEHRRDPGPPPERRRLCLIFGAQGGLAALWALLAPVFGAASGGARVAPVWDALLGIETLAFAVLVATASDRLRLAAAARSHHRTAPDDASPDSFDDALTGVANRRALQSSGAALLDACRSAGRPTALLSMDLDGLDGVNDRHGPAAGDALLTAFARLAHDYLPPTGLVCRTGGGELTALLPGADLGRARAVADEMRALFAHLVLDGPAGPLRTTVSIGVAEDPGGPGPTAQADLVALMARAETCRRAAKRGGRDRVVAEGDPEAAAETSARRSAA